VKVVVGEAVKSLPNLPATSPSDLFDLAFIDADKINNLNYFRESERLVRPGGVIIVDNVVRHGRVADPDIKDGDDDNVDGVRKLLKYIAESKTVEATTIATVGNKGFDGFLYAYKL
jgi:predicted O-methyltransferase YrrM